MPTPQALGGALTYNPFLTADANAKILQLQQQQAIAQALLGEGMQPVDTKDRQIGGVGYRISPLEGLAKMAQILSGRSGQSDAIQGYKDLYAPQPTPQQTGDALNQQSGVGPTQAAAGQAQMNAAIGNPNLSAMGRALAGAGPYAQGLAFSDPNELLKLAATSAFADHRAGSSYYDANTGGRSFIPTDQQQNDMPFGGNQTSQVSPTNQGMIPPSGPALQEYRDANGMGTPPVDIQRQNAGMPVGTSSIQPVDLNSAPNLAGGNPLPPPATAFSQPNITTPIPSQPLAPLPGESSNSFHARLDAWKAAATKTAEIGPAGATTEATKNAENLTDASKTFNAAAGNLPRAMQRFAQLREAAKNASYGGGVSEEDPGSTFGDYARNYARTASGQFFEPGRATSNQIIDQATKQGVLSELGPQLAGLKGNKFLESIASGASGLNPADPSDTKINAINGLQDQYISNLKSLAEQRRNYGDKSAPTDIDLAKLISQNAEPTSKISVVSPDGKLGRVDAAHLIDLINAGGKIR